MTITLHLPADQQARLEGLAAARGLTPEQALAELVAATLGTDTEPDALEAFIGSGDSGDPSWAGRDTAELRAEATAGRRAG